MISSPSGPARRSTYNAGPARPGQVSVDGETFTLDQTGRNAAPQPLIEQPAEQIAVTKTFVAILRKGRVIGHLGNGLPFSEGPRQRTQS